MPVRSGNWARRQIARAAVAAFGAPGGPSRWSTERTGQWEPVDPKIVVEVAYDHFTGERFRHGTKILRSRQDKGPKQCTMDQVKGREGKSLALLQRATPSSARS